MIAIGDKVYYRYRIGMFNRTRSGVVTAINGDIATVSYMSQNSSGVQDVQITVLTKNKIQ